MVSKTTIGLSVMLWVLPRPGIKGGQRDKIRCCGPHPLERGVQRSAHMEAIAHLRQGLALLQTLPETPERVQREVDVLLALGASLLATTGYGTPEVAQTYRRAHHLCHHLAEPQQLFPEIGRA